jgi:hypothetical protein
MTMPILLTRKGVSQSFIRAANLVRMLLAFLIVTWEEAISCFSALMDWAGIRVILPLFTRVDLAADKYFSPGSLFFISAMTLTAGTGHDVRFSLDLSVRRKERLNIEDKNF